MTRKRTRAGCGIAEAAEGTAVRAVEGLVERAATGGVADDAAGGASDGASRPAASPGEGSAAAHPAHGMAVSVLVVAALLVLTQLYAAIPLLGPVGAAMGGDATFALSTSFSAPYALGFLVWGPVSDRYGRKRVMVVSIGVLAAATLACAAVSSLTMLSVLRALQGAAASGFAPVALAYLTEAVAPRRRARAIGAMSTAFLVAGIVGQVLASATHMRAHHHRCRRRPGARPIHVSAPAVREPRGSAHQAGYCSARYRARDAAAVLRGPVHRNGASS